MYMYKLYIDFKRIRSLTVLSCSVRPGSLDNK